MSSTAPETLSAGPLRFVRAARLHGYCVRVDAYEMVTEEHTTKAGDIVPERVWPYLRIRGWRPRDGRRFAVQWRDGKADVAYWWTTIHHAVASYPTEDIVWQSEHPAPRKVSSTDLKHLITTTGRP